MGGSSREGDREAAALFGPHPSLSLSDAFLALPNRRDEPASASASACGRGSVTTEYLPDMIFADTSLHYQKAEKTGVPTKEGGQGCGYGRDWHHDENRP